MKLEELIKLQNKWVAFSKDRKKVIQKASSMEELFKKIKNQKDLIVTFMHPADRFLSP
jgi:predicted RNase H-like HicB family nuclease